MDDAPAAQAAVVAAPASATDDANAHKQVPNVRLALKTEVATGEAADHVMLQLTDRLGKIGAELSQRLTSFATGVAGASAAPPLTTTTEDEPAVQQAPGSESEII